jgi:hypothetical protein
MNRYILTTLAALTLTTVAAPAVQAEPTAFNPTVVGETTIARQLSPVALVTLAQQGKLQAQGIPSYGALVIQYQLGQLDAQTLIQGAIQANRLPAEVASNQGYVNAVNTQLQIISNAR